MIRERILKAIKDQGRTNYDVIQAARALAESRGERLGYAAAYEFLDGKRDSLTAKASLLMEVLGLTVEKKPSRRKAAK